MVRSVAPWSWRHVASACFAVGLVVFVVGARVHAPEGRVNESTGLSMGLVVLALNSVGGEIVSGDGSEIGSKIFRDGFWHLQGLGPDHDCDCGWVTQKDRCQQIGGRCYETCKEMNADSFCKFSGGGSEIGSKISRDGFWHLQGLGPDRDCDCQQIGGMMLRDVQGDECGFFL